jgi:hypothetical protein
MGLAAVLAELVVFPLWLGQVTWPEPTLLGGQMHPFCFTQAL